MTVEDGAAEGTESRVASAVERRIVSVLFADLVGFTSLSERLDAEDVATIQDAYFASVRETVGRYGGELEKFIGDAAMAVFGIPRARDGDAERAVRAGLAIVAAVDQLGARLDLEGGDLRLRVGVNTGEVVHAVVGTEAGRVTGDTVNTAARLQTAAQPGTVLVGEETALAIADSIELEGVAPLELKGKSSPVRAWRVVGVRPERSRELAMGSLRAPTIGRDEPLRALGEAVGRLGADGGADEARAERWLIVAPPGGGKTRLVDELAHGVAASVSGPLVWRIRLRPESTGPFEPLALLADAALDATTRHATAPDLDGIRARLAAAGLPAGRAEVVAAELLALAQPAFVQETGSAPDRAARFEAWLDGLDALAGSRGQAWIVEDAHWAAPDLVAFLDAATDRPAAGGRLLVVTARTSFLGDAPSWAAADAASGRHVLELPTLPATDAATLVHELVGEALPQSLVERIAERSDGNCLFIEELLRTWVGTGALVLEGDGEADGSRNRWRLAIPADDAPLPHTVQAIYAAQLDDLPSEARQAARRGAVAGRRFPLAALDSLGVPEAADAVAELTRRALIGGPFADPVTGDAFAYRHALLRDAGYASLARAQRADLHVRLARWLESAAREAPDAVAAAIGDHLATALASAPALAAEVAPGLRRDACADEAAAWLERAAEHALAEGAAATAAGLFRRSARLTRPESPADLSRRLTALGRALAPIGGLEEASDALRDAVDAARAARVAGLPIWRVLFANATDALATLLYEQIRFVDAWHLGDAAIAEMGDADDLPVARVRLARSRGQSGETNEARVWVADAERAVAAARAEGDESAEYEFRRELARARTEAGTATVEDWIALGEQARARGDAVTEVSARTMEAAYRMDDDPSAAPPILERARELAIARGLVERLGWIEHATAEAALGAGDWQATIDAGLRAVELGERHGYDRISVRSWAALLPAASLRGEREVLERGAHWFEERQGKLPDSPYGRVLHAACALRIAAGTGGPVHPPDLEHVRPAIAQWIDQGGFEWLAATDAILDAWFAAGRLDWVRAVVEGTSATPPSAPSPAQTAGLELARIRLEAASAEPDHDRAERTRTLLAAFRSIGLPFWEARTIRVLAGLGAAADADTAEREAIEARLSVVRPVL